MSCGTLRYDILRGQEKQTTTNKDRGGLKYEWRRISDVAFGTGANRCNHDIFICQGFEEQETGSITIGINIKD